MSKVETRFFSLTETIDWSKILIEKPTTSSFTKEGSTISTCTSLVYYVEKGKKYKVLFEIAPQEILGIFENFVMSKPKIQENLNGYQITYPLNSFHTIECPEKEEVETKNRFDFLHKASVDAIIKFCEEENAKENSHDADQLQKPENVRTEYTSSLPGPTRSQYTQAANRKRPALAVKALYELAKVKDEKSGQKITDPSKSKVAYLKLMTKGLGDKLEVNTDIYGPNNKLMPATAFVWNTGDGKTKKGLAHPVILWDRIYFGQHGNTPCGASNKIFVAEMNYTPSEGSSIRIPRCLGPNNSVATIMEENMNEYSAFNDVNNEEVGENTGFGTGDESEETQKEEESVAEEVVPETAPEVIIRKKKSDRSEKVERSEKKKGSSKDRK